MRQMPESVQEEINAGLDSYGRQLASAMRQRAPNKTGATRAGISHKLFPKTLKLQVGLVGTKRGRAKLFYARILDLGRRAQTVIVHRFRRGTRASGEGKISRGRKIGSVSSYAMNVRAIRPMRFVTGPLTDLRAGLNRHLKDVWNRALQRSAGGSD